MRKKKAVDRRVQEEDLISPYGRICGWLLTVKRGILTLRRKKMRL